MKLVVIAGVGLTLAFAAGSGSRLGKLRILSGDYPRAFFFRQSEGLAANPRIPWEEWDKTFSRLMGIEGKVLEEEVPGRSKRNPEFFARFKKAHPDQLVLLHYNGNARDPRDAGEKYFAGHWEYQEGAKITADVPAQAGESELPVSDPRRFRVNIGRYKNARDDIGLFVLKADGTVDWAAAEQVQLLAVDAAKGTIRVKRGCFGTKPLAFAAGKAYAAAHRSEGPWGNDSHMLWFYNHATDCPRDAHGRTCTDVMVEELGALFQPGAQLQDFDGLEFDVLRHSAGVTEFVRRLREKLGPDRLLMADGWSQNNQRAFGLMNGIESEGWPALRDIEVKDWSGGLNRQSFWTHNSAAPQFSYINHKFNVGGEIQKSAPFATTRLVFAGAMFTDAALCYSLYPEPEAGERVGIWDELQMGTAHRLGWLGKPVGEPVHLAMKTKNLLAGRAVPAASDLILTVPTHGPDLVLRITAHAGKEPQLWFFGKSYSWINQTPFVYEYYSDDVKGEQLTLDIKAEDAALIKIQSVEAYAHPDATYREFERGLVLANPSSRPYTFDLASLLPGKRYRRLQGSPHQDTKTNDGSAVGDQVTLGPRDGLFLTATSK